jgi:hypothetical protein
MCTLASLKFAGGELASLLLAAGASTLHTFSLRDCHLVTTLGGSAVDQPTSTVYGRARSGGHGASGNGGLGSADGSSGDFFTEDGRSEPSQTDLALSGAAAAAVAAGGYNGGYGSGGSDRRGGSALRVLLPRVEGPSAAAPFAPLTCINLSGCHNLVDRCVACRA